MKMAMVDIKAAGRPVSLRRGFGMLGLTSLIAVLAMLTAAVAIASMRSGTGSIRGVQRLQVQAAAEGAAVLMGNGQSGDVTLGECRVTVTEGLAPVFTGVAGEVPLSRGAVRVDLMKGGDGLVAYSRSYKVTVMPGSGMPVVEAVR